jgi:hypothetical protein
LAPDTVIPPGSSHNATAPPGVDAVDDRDQLAASEPRRYLADNRIDRVALSGQPSVVGDDRHPLPASGVDTAAVVAGERVGIRGRRRPRQQRRAGLLGEQALGDTLVNRRSRCRVAGSAGSSRRHSRAPCAPKSRRERWAGLVDAMARDMKISREEADQLAPRSIPLGRIAECDEVANLVTYLASDLAHFNGTMIEIDGGQQKPLMDRFRDR